MGLPPITDEEVEAATYAHGSKDMPERNIVEDIKFAQEIINKNRNGLEVVKALAQGGFTDVAQDMLNIQKAKLTGITCIPPPLSLATDRCYPPSMMLTTMPVRQQVIACKANAGKRSKTSLAHLIPTSLAKG